MCAEKRKECRALQRIYAHNWRICVQENKAMARSADMQQAGSKPPTNLVRTKQLWWEGNTYKFIRKRAERRSRNIRHVHRVRCRQAVEPLCQASVSARHPRHQYAENGKLDFDPRRPVLRSQQAESLRRHASPHRQHACTFCGVKIQWRWLKVWAGKWRLQDTEEEGEQAHPL